MVADRVTPGTDDTKAGTELANAARRRRNEQVGTDGLVDAGRGRLRNRRPEHGDGRDQGDADH